MAGPVDGGGRLGELRLWMRDFGFPVVLLCWILWRLDALVVALMPLAAAQVQELAHVDRVVETCCVGRVAPHLDAWTPLTLRGEQEPSALGGK